MRATPEAPVERHARGAAAHRATGELSQLPGKAGCIADVPPFTGCTDSRGLNAIAIALSHDGRNAYVTSNSDAIAVCRRAR